jgi:hypothetical protein
MLYSYCCENVSSCSELFTADVLLHWRKEVDVSCWVQGLACAMNGQYISRRTAPGIALLCRLCGSIFMASLMSFFMDDMAYFSPLILP